MNIGTGFVDDYQREIDFLQRVDRIITGNVKIRLRKIKGLSALAYANLKDKSININFKSIEEKYSQDDKMQFIALCKGFNYHELSHLLFCKHHSLTIPQTEEIMSILNALQDGRDETLMSKAFPRTRKHFENCFMKVIHSNKWQLQPIMFLATHSRRLIITSDIVKAYWEKVFRKSFGDETTDEVKNLIDEYITTNPPKKQLLIANKIFDLLNKNARNKKQSMTDLSNFSTSSSQTLKALLSQSLPDMTQEERKEMEKIVKQIRKEQSKKTDKSPELSEEMNKEIEHNEQQNDLLNQKHKETEEAQNEGMKIREELRDTENKLGEKLKQILQEKDEQKKKELQKERIEIEKELNILADKSRKNVVKKNEINEKVSEIKEKITHEEIEGEANNKSEMISQKLQDEIIDDLKTIYKNDSAGYGAGQDDNPDMDKPDSDPLIIEPRHRINSRKLQEAIKNIKNKQRKGYIEEQASGKVNMQKAMNIQKTGNLNVFRKFLPDKRNQTKIGTIIILDSSGTMSDKKFDRALQSTWIIQDAMTKTGNPTLIMEFGSTTRIVKPFKSKGEYKRHLIQGNTNVIPPLLEAKRQIKMSSKVDHIEHWAVFIITDGEWSDGSGAEEIIDELNKKDVETMLIHIPLNEREKMIGIGKHHCKHTATIIDVDELSNLLRTCIKKMQINIESKIKRKGV